MRPSSGPECSGQVVGWRDGEEGSDLGVLKIPLTLAQQPGVQPGGCDVLGSLCHVLVLGEERYLASSSSLPLHEAKGASLMIKASLLQTILRWEQRRS